MNNGRSSETVSHWRETMESDEKRWRNPRIFGGEMAGDEAGARENLDSYFDYNTLKLFGILLKKPSPAQPSPAQPNLPQPSQAQPSPDIH